MNLGYLLFVVGDIALILAGLYQLAKGIRLLRQMRLLDAQGISTTAQILSLDRKKQWFSKAVNIFVTYHYTPAGSAEKIQRTQMIDRPMEHRLSTTPGREITITYLPDHPHIAMLTNKFRDSSERDSALVSGGFMLFFAFWGMFFIIDKPELALVIFLGIFGAGFIFLSLFLLWGTYHLWQDVRRLSQEGVQTQGRILEKQVSDAGRGGKVFSLNYEYWVQHPDGRKELLYTKQVVGGFSYEMEPGAEIEVRYLADKPKISMLAGKVQDNSGRFLGLWLVIILLPLGVYMLSTCLNLLRDL